MLRLALYILIPALTLSSCAFRRSCGMTKQKVLRIENGNYKSSKQFKKNKKRSKGRCTRWVRWE